MKNYILITFFIAISNLVSAQPGKNICENCPFDVQLIGFWELNKVEVADSSMVEGPYTVQSFSTDELYNVNENLIQSIQIFRGYGIIVADTVEINAFQNKCMIKKDVHEQMFDYETSQSELVLKNSYFTNNGEPIKRIVTMYLRRR